MTHILGLAERQEHQRNGGPQSQAHQKDRRQLAVVLGRLDRGVHRRSSHCSLLRERPVKAAVPNLKHMLPSSSATTKARPVVVRL